LQLAAAQAIDFEKDGLQVRWCQTLCKDRHKTGYAGFAFDTLYDLVHGFSCAA